MNTLTSSGKIGLVRGFAFPDSLSCFQKGIKTRKTLVALGLGLLIVVSVIHLTIHGAPNTAASSMAEKSQSYIFKNFHRPRLKILVVSYMRSGSTLCGNILQAHPGVFYVYEPLLYLWDHYVPGKNHYKNLTLRRRAKAMWRDSKPVIPRPLDFLSYMFRCNVTAYNLDFLTNVAHSKAFVESDCVQIIEKTNVLNVTKQCAQGVFERCQASKAIAQKAVRLTLAEGSQLLHEDPSIRLVHLVRDPRGVLLSRMRFNKKMTGEMHKNYTAICHRMLVDLKASKRLNKEHWGNT
ncbi:carbohydrate sulfotransferase 1 [Plakobranchus ocellatus]|uniref:Carbohydrate sulfotransferase 1 n=1 Tax=Plakobranchus ocellatus TaxID=259542 RepID=A0AAV3YZ05_9GAST|nr:carbohydrate sulfotransferase 1 [Plakobranchus ocellatus]